MDYGRLREELANARYAGKSDGEIAAMLNAPSDSRVPRGIVPKDVFLDLVTQPFLAIKALPDGSLKEKWLDRLDLLSEVTQVNTDSGTMTGFLNELVADGLMAESAIADIQTRPATCAESLFGAGSIVTAEDIARALRG